MNCYLVNTICFIIIISSIVPLPTSVTITKHDDVIFVGVPFNLTCEINFPTTVDISVTVEAKWTKPDGMIYIPTNVTTMTSFTHYIGIATFNLTESRSALYTCEAIVNTNSESVYLIQNSETTIGTLNITVGKILC